jgi:hypothetical protein
MEKIKETKEFFEKMDKNISIKENQRVFLKKNLGDKIKWLI